MISGNTTNKRDRMVNITAVAQASAGEATRGRPNGTALISRQAQMDDGRAQSRSRAGQVVQPKAAPPPLPFWNSAARGGRYPAMTLRRAPTTADKELAEVTFGRNTEPPTVMASRQCRATAR